MRLNGWRRLWTVATCFGLFFSLWHPFYTSREYGLYWSNFKASLEKDIENEACRDYVYLPLKRLPEPPADGECYYLHFSREIDQRWGETVPYTMHVYESNIQKLRMKMFATSALIYGIGAMVISILVYVAGSALGSIIRWFRRVSPDTGSS